MLDMTAANKNELKSNKLSTKAQKDCSVSVVVVETSYDAKNASIPTFSKTSGKDMQNQSSFQDAKQSSRYHADPLLNWHACKSENSKMTQTEMQNQHAAEVNQRRSY